MGAIANQKKPNNPRTKPEGLFRSAKIFQVFDNNFFNYATNSLPTIFDVPIIRATPNGLAVFTDGTNDCLDYGDINLGNFTYVWVGIPRDVTDQRDEAIFACDDFGESDISSGRDVVGLKQARSGSSSTTEGTIEVQVGGTGSAVNLTGGLVQDQLNVVIIRRNGNTVKGFVDAVERASITVSSNVAERTFQFQRLGCHRFSGSNNEFADADHIFYGVFNRPWSDEEVKIFSHEWASFLKPKRRIVPFVAAVAGGVRRAQLMTLGVS